MSPNQPVANPYTDDRRNPGPYDSYRPRDRDRQPPPHRDSRGSRDGRRDNESPRPQIDTGSSRDQEGPGNRPGNSPAGAPDKPSSELKFKRMNVASQKSVTTASSSTINGPPTPVIPKAKNPELQEAFENAYRWGETGNKRLLLSMRKTKDAQENNQRQRESEKILAKAPGCPPYHNLVEKFSLVDRGLDDQLKAVEDNYNTELEQLIARFATIAKPTPTSHTDPTVLEVKLEEISRLAAQQSQQIQGLLNDNQSYRSSIASLETGFNDLKTKYSVLKSDRDALESKSREHSNTINALQLRQASIDAENKDLQRQLEELRTTTTKTSSESSQVLERINGIEIKLDDFKDFDEFKDKLDELDPTTLNEICDAWVSTEYNLKSQYEEYSRRHGQNGLSVDDALRPFQQELDSLRIELSPLVTGAGMGLPTEELEAIINAKLAAAEKSINDKTNAVLEGSHEMVGDMIDAAEARITKLEQQNQKLVPNHLSELARPEGQTVGPRVERIDHDVRNLNQKYEGLKSEVGKLVNREWVDLRIQELLTSFGMNAGVAEVVKDLQSKALKVDAIEQAVKTLNAQYQNLSTKQLAEYIVRLTNPAFEQRLVQVEAKTSQLKDANNEYVITHSEQLGSITALLSTLLPKQTASPSHGDEPNKKRKLDFNGRHPSPLQWQQHQQQQQQHQQQQQQHQQRNSPVQHPSS
ncbi:hypothetical protein F5B18DRAFT_543885 [Nemania serpens]|nr:hypothetical protein F5B18DRAFT_543885 [Nemania serpens]